MYPHRIRLRGPWECEPLAGAGGQVVPPPCRINLPERWSEGPLRSFAGRLRLRRRFGYPGRLDSWERVWLTFAYLEGTADIALNGRSLGRHADGAFEFEVTDLLGSRNELTVELEVGAGEGGLCGEVAMEIRCTALLRGVALRGEKAGETIVLHATGEVAGSCERPLDLYLLLDGSTLAYAAVEASAAGQPFHLRSEPLEPGRPLAVCLELINGAVVWYRIEQQLRLE